MFLRNLFFTLIFIFVMGFFYSCEIINPNENIPSYIHIDSISLTNVNHPEYGSTSHKITDAWVYVDDQLIGAFELPATFPVLFSGSHTVTIKAGIKVNGISGTRAIYPFYTPNISKINLNVGSVVTINPTLTYNSYTNFAWKEAFEDGGISLIKTINSDTIIMQTSDSTKVFEGSFSGVVNLDANKPLFQCQTANSFGLPTGSDNPVFLEMNYKANQEFLIGLFATNSTETQKLEALYVNKSTNWNKIYINLKSAIELTTISNPKYQIFIEAEKSSDVTTTELLFDNIKLVYNN